MTKRDSNRGGLNERHRHLVELLAGGASITAAALAVGMSRQRVSDLTRKSPHFRAALEVRRHEVLSELRGKLQAAVMKAAEVTLQLLDDEEVSPNVKLQVAAGLLWRTERFFTSAAPEPRDAEQIAEELIGEAQLDPLQALRDETGEKQRLLDLDVDELEKDGRLGVA
ncbi:hypothetical protein Apau_1662 [Aminomonas paucivorans DSM 12260]|uniref:Uncharacterized protein n=1 Tax=Aminomonas paucivorans DSM 12260 TaxID=584708 RepID=E3CUV5_9BACT|nr:hypothetical protein Apau_1662 [Aminomonas paucivorans DSM 12260]